jgi:ketosteroid isomerase-like protein
VSRAVRRNAVREIHDVVRAATPTHERLRARAWFNSMEDVWTRLSVDAEEVTELDAERVLAAVRFSGFASGSGMDIEQRVAIVCTIRDGKAVRWQIYPSAEPRA